jgi:hypothetical protein
VKIAAWRDWQATMEAGISSLVWHGVSRMKQQID